MNYRKLGKSDLVLSELGFGAFGISGSAFSDSYGPTNDANSLQAIYAALELGCNFFDTADVYGCGHSETLIGEALSNNSLGKDTVIATKGGCRLDHPGQQDFSREYLFSAVEGSLRRLRRQYIDLYLLHNPSAELISDGEIFDTLERLQRDGKIRYGGISVHSADEGLASIQHPACSVVQIVFNLFSHLHPERAADGLLGAIADTGVGLIAREPLANGFLARRHTIHEEFSVGDTRAELTETERRLRIVLAESLRPNWSGAPTSAQLALRYVLDEPLVSTAIVGIKTKAQVEENFGSTEIAPFAVQYEKLVSLKAQGAKS